MTTEKPNVSPTGRFSVRQAAQVLQVHENTVRNWIKNGEFKAYELSVKQVGRKNLIIRGSALIRVWGATN
ncbi:MAG: helix-turn-helix domain-containing protein [Prevotellaceae bacterium]|nr:helix-turn-helix domain-containing protein [Prevotellaceae bacterium]